MAKVCPIWLPSDQDAGRPIFLAVTFVVVVVVPVTPFQLPSACMVR